MRLMRLAGRFPFFRSHGELPGTYAEWIERHDRLEQTDVRGILRQIDGFSRPPHFHVLLMPAGAGPEALDASLASLQDQFYRRFSCTVLDAAAPHGRDLAHRDVPGIAFRHVAHADVRAWLDMLNSELAGQRRDEWVILLRAGDVLAAHALYWLAHEAQLEPDAVLMYSDDDSLDSAGRRRDPAFKPDWSPSLLLSNNYIGDAAALRGSAVAAAGGVTLDCCRHGNYDLLLRVMDCHAGAARIAHIPAVLLHKPEELATEDGQWDSPPARRRALQAHLDRVGQAGELEETMRGAWRIRYRLPQPPPLVSVVVPTRDAPALLRRCVDSLLEKTSYPRLELLLVDNGSVDPAARAYLEQAASRKPVRLLRFDQPFNYSAINNYAVGQARGEVICLLNNDTEVITPDWLEEMLGQLLQERVGVVGAKLLYPDGRVQHGGDFVGVGEAACHAHAFLDRDDPGYMGRAKLAQDMSAVTGACLMVRKADYEALGGLDEKEFPVAFNDVDFCLRTRRSGRRVVWTPHALLYHHESASRGRERSRKKTRQIRRQAASLRRRWGEALLRDPFYNPNLNQRRPDFSLGNAAGVVRPWRNPLISS